MAEYVISECVLEEPDSILGYWRMHERIVRCRDCESATDHCEGMDIYWCEYLSRYVGADMFCAWGEKGTEQPRTVKLSELFGFWREDE